jgi:16S rRNA processing protein RimM
MTGAPSDDTKKRVLLGRIGSAQGIQGEVRIQSFCADPLAIASYGPLATNRGGLTVEIVKARLAKDMVVASLKGVIDRTAAETLNGVELFITRDRLPPEDDTDDFYYADLIGLSVRAPDGRTIGTVKAIDDYGAGDVVEIALETGASALYAFTRANFPEIAVDAGYLVLDPPAEVELRE